MKFTFLDDKPETNLKPILISGEDSLNITTSVYIKHEDDDGIKAIFEIRGSRYGGPFQQATIEDDMLAIGYSDSFYLFSLKEKRSILKLAMHGYFGHVYYHENCFYVADAGSLYRINNAGTIIWRTKGLGIDGVIINDFTDDTITGSGEWDPPGGWRDFVLDKYTGMLLKDI